ncbi:hypothetical protein CAPTEDRAFT_219460 [Capitella teleta]|uniref:Reelin domain-containing protein n=1 Tax=Capitella teleta TaxID=283909 RepID=R7VG21_CAPTE|nr:hypothetical protein CAPTEDRAFT_219460 [Capitella teleta]|eukprot:ELU15236.1 hypothetical protein CAPTEDRAFT_219460 [Capitella teleta]
MMWKFVVLSLVMSLSSVHCYGSGPPLGRHPEVCRTMKPSHGVDPMDSEPPFLLTTGSICYKPLGLVPVSITNASIFYEGFFVLAKVSEEDNDAYGRFIREDSDKGTVQTQDCFDKVDSGISHSDDPHFFGHNFTWHAPDNFTDAIHFVATIVHETKEYWMNIRSGHLIFDEACDIETMDWPTSSAGKHSFTLLAAILAILSHFM